MVSAVVKACQRKKKLQSRTVILGHMVSAWLWYGDQLKGGVSTNYNVSSLMSKLFLSPLLPLQLMEEKFPKLVISIEYALQALLYNTLHFNWTIYPARVEKIFELSIHFKTGICVLYIFLSFLRRRDSFRVWRVGRLPRLDKISPHLWVSVYYKN